MLLPNIISFSALYELLGFLCPIASFREVQKCPVTQYKLSYLFYKVFFVFFVVCHSSLSEENIINILVFRTKIFIAAWLGICGLIGKMCSGRFFVSVCSFKYKLNSHALVILSFFFLLCKGLWYFELSKSPLDLFYVYSSPLVISIPTVIYSSLTFSFSIHLFLHVFFFLT